MCDKCNVIQWRISWGGGGGALLEKEYIRGNRK